MRLVSHPKWEKTLENITDRTREEGTKEEGKAKLTQTLKQ